MIVMTDKMDKPKLGWGGRRDNQHGRPKLPTELRRVNLNTKVKPETKDWFEEQSTPTGQILDMWVQKELNKKD